MGERSAHRGLYVGEFASPGVPATPVYTTGAHGPPEPVPQATTPPDIPTASTRPRSKGG